MTEIAELEENTYHIIDLLQGEDSKQLRSQSTKLLLKISQTIDVLHESLKQKLALHKASPGAYLGAYNTLMQVDRLFQLEEALKEALGVKEKTSERIATAKKKLPIRISGARYKLPKRKRNEQLEFPFAVVN